jgi:hypothetical protein
MGLLDLPQLQLPLLDFNAVAADTAFAADPPMLLPLKTPMPPTADAADFSATAVDLISLSYG